MNWAAAKQRLNLVPPKRRRRMRILDEFAEQRSQSTLPVPYLHSTHESVFDPLGPADVAEWFTVSLLSSAALTKELKKTDKQSLWIELTKQRQSDPSTVRGRVGTTIALATLAENRDVVDLSYFEETGELCPKRLATRVHENSDSELAARALHFLIILRRSAAAKSELESLMANASLPLMSLDYCFRYYHFAFRNQLNDAMHISAIAYLGGLLVNDNLDIADKSAFSIGEFYLYNPHAEVRSIAKSIILSADNQTDRVCELLNYTKRRVGL
jgi:hypothetical protein